MRLASLLAAGAALAASAALLSIAAPQAAAKGGGGGGAPPPVESGRIYFHTGPNGVPSGLHAMNPDGTGIAALPASISGWAEPSRLRHGGARWFLQAEAVAGTFPNGAARTELFAVNETGTLHVQLTNGVLPGGTGFVEPSLPRGLGDQWSLYPRWATRDGIADGKVSYAARGWASVEGTWSVMEFGVYVLDVEPENLTSHQPVTPTHVALTLNSPDPTHPVAGNCAPDWSPDGTRIAYVTHDTLQGLWVADANGLNRLRLTTDPIGRLRWAPDGPRIVFDSTEGLEVIGADGTGRTLLAAHPTGKSVSKTLRWPLWSPQGGYVAYTFETFDSPKTHTYEVYRMRADGSGKTRLADGTAVAWRAD